MDAQVDKYRYKHKLTVGRSQFLRGRDVGILSLVGCLPEQLDEHQTRASYVKLFRFRVSAR